MSKRLETIRRLAATDPYWRGYLDGLNRAREADTAEHAEHARLLQARLDRVQARRENWDDDWSPLPAA